MRDQIFIKNKGQYIKLKIDEIIWIESIADTCNIYTEKRNYKVKFPLKALIENISVHQFMEIRDYTFINLKHIISIDLLHNKVQLTNTELLIEPRYKSSLVDKLNVF